MRRGFLNKGNADPKTSTPSNDDKLKPSPTDVATSESSADLDAMRAHEAKIQNTNHTPGLFTKFRASDFSGQITTYHNLMIGDFEVATVLDSRVLAVFPEPFKPLPPNPPNTFTIKSTETRGLGLFACRKIAAGELIMAEHPAVVMLAFRVGGQSQTEMCRALFSRLDPPAREQLYRLSNCKRPEECGVEEGIMRTNNFGISLPIPEGMNPQLALHTSVYLNISRCNHSCGPNANRHWDLETFSMSVLASTPIAAGDEITLNYVGVKDAREVRNAKLRKMYNFDCTCKYCDLPDDEAIAISDRNREEIPKLCATINSNTSQTLDERIKAHMQAMRRIHREGLFEDEWKHCMALAACHYERGDFRMFTLWGKRAADVHKARRDLPMVDAWAGWLSDPRSFIPMVPFTKSMS